MREPKARAYDVLNKINDYMKEYTDVLVRQVFVRFPQVGINGRSGRLAVVWTISRRRKFTATIVDLIWGEFVRVGRVHEFVSHAAHSVPPLLIGVKYQYIRSLQRSHEILHIYHALFSILRNRSPNMASRWASIATRVK